MKAFVLIFGLRAKALNMNTILALVRPVFFTSGMLENTSVQGFTKLGSKSLTWIVIKNLIQFFD